MSDQTRPARPTMDELRAVCQPPSVRERHNSEHWVADLYGRRISIYITSVLVRTPVTANQATWVGVVVVGVASAFALLIPGLPGALLAAVLAQLQMVLDSTDGEIARWRGTSSPKGVFIDRVAHYATEGLIPIALGLRAAGFPSADWTASPWPFVGALLAVLVLWNKSLNDMVHVARAFNNLPRLQDKATVGVPTSGGIRRLRSLARFVPFHRSYHSVELTLLALVAAFIDVFVGGTGNQLIATQWLVGLLAVLGLLTVIGHLIAILSSSRLK